MDTHATQRSGESVPESEYAINTYSYFGLLVSTKNGAIHRSINNEHWLFVSNSFSLSSVFVSEHKWRGDFWLCGSLTWHMQSHYFIHSLEGMQKIQCVCPGLPQHQDKQNLKLIYIYAHGGEIQLKLWGLSLTALLHLGNTKKPLKIRKYVTLIFHVCETSAVVVVFAVSHVSNLPLWTGLTIKLSHFTKEK